MWRVERDSMTESPKIHVENGRWVQKFFEHGSNKLIVQMIAALFCALVVMGAFRSSLPFVLLGVAIFGFVEYLTHRFTLHAPPSKIKFISKLQHRLHYDHHVTPERLDLLFIPPWFLLPVLGIYGGLYYLLTSSVAVTLALTAGNLIGLLHYERVHYIAHIPVTPSTAFGRYMKKYHLWHHFKNEGYWFGVTNPLGDYLFKTYKDPTEVDKSATVKNLHSGR